MFLSNSSLSTLRLLVISFQNTNSFAGLIIALYHNHKISLAISTHQNEFNFSHCLIAKSSCFCHWTFLNKFVLDNLISHKFVNKFIQAFAVSFTAVHTVQNKSFQTSSA